MDFQEYMLAINATTLSSPEDKLTWVFNVFDGDGGGTIDAKEIKTMMEGLFEMAGAKVNEEQLAVRRRGDREFPFPVIPGKTSLKFPFLWHFVISLPVPGKRKFWPGIRTGNIIFICSFVDGWSRHENE